MVLIKSKEVIGHGNGSVSIVYHDIDAKPPVNPDTLHEANTVNLKDVKKLVDFAKEQGWI